MDSPSSTSHDAASQLEKGEVNVEGPVSATETAAQSPRTERSSTFKSIGTFKSIDNSIQWVKRRSSSLGKAMMPKISPGKPNMIIPSLESFPDGYPQLGCFLDSDESFMMYRRFGLLHSRLLLHKQDRLRELEEELQMLDRVDARSEEGRLALQCREEDDAREPPPAPRRSRTMLLQEIETELTAYGRVLTQAQQLCAMNKPSTHDHRSVINFFENVEPLVEEERKFIYHQEDLVTIRAGRENAWLDAVVEKFLRLYPCRPMKYLFCSEATRAKSQNPDIHYFSRPRINFFVTLIITFLILGLLVAPIWILFYLTVILDGTSTETASIGVLLVSTLLFSSVLSLFTRARRHEILAAAAGYCAVLVVFVGNIGNRVP